MSSALGLCAVVALFALAADQHRGLVTADELATVGAYKSMLQNLAEMDKQLPLASPLSDKKKKAVHKTASTDDKRLQVCATRINPAYTLRAPALSPGAQLFVPARSEFPALPTPPRGISSTINCPHVEKPCAQVGEFLPPQFWQETNLFGGQAPLSMVFLCASVLGQDVVPGGGLGLCKLGK